MPAPKIAPEQVTRTELVTHPDGTTSKRLFVKLTREQKAYFKKARAEVMKEFPPKKKPTRQRLEMLVGDDDGPLLAAVDKYAADNSLPNRGAVLRVAIARLVGIELPIPHHGWKAGRTRRAKKAAVRKSVSK